MTAPGDWTGILEGHDAVINSAGALQDGLADDIAATQAKAMQALYVAAKQSPVQLIVQISARTQGAAADLPFLATKRQADEALVSSGIPYVILRPALVLGRNACFWPMSPAQPFFSAQVPASPSSWSWRTGRAIRR